MTKVYEREYWEASLGAAIGHMSAVMLIYYWVNDAWTDWLVMPDFHGTQVCSNCDGFLQLHRMYR